jgi:hypothetical protein
MHKYPILATLVVGAAFSAHADNTSPGQFKPPAASVQNQTGPSSAQLNSTALGTHNVASAGTAGGAGAGRAAGTNATGTGGGSGKVVEKSPGSDPKKASPATNPPPPPAPSVAKGASVKPQAKPQIKQQPHLI